MNLIRKYNKKQWIPTLLTALSAFCVYACMYAYRKPFTVAEFNGLSFLGMDYKIWLVIAQTTGYTISKFYGIRFIAELKHGRRAALIVKFIGIGWMAMFFFAVIPPPYNIVLLAINGFPLGVIYGIVFSYLEGRRSSEFLGAVLATSFIFASGFTQSIGKYIMIEWGVSQWWMPFIVGLIFLLPLLFFVWVLESTPSPDLKDLAERTRRTSMNAAERKCYLKTFLQGLSMLVLTYIILTILRDYRSNFAADIWKELGHGKETSLFTITEVPASIVVLVLMSLLVMVKNNLHALMINHAIIIFGFLLSFCTTILFSYQYLSPFWWITLTGIGLYMGYVPFNAMLFDRLIATFKYAGNAGFIIYVADSFGYLGSDTILIFKSFMNSDISWSDFFIRLVIYGSAFGIVLIISAWIYFYKKHHTYIFVPPNLTYG